MIIEIEDELNNERCLIKIDGKRVLNCTRYKIVHDAAHIAPKVILYLSPTEVKFKGTIEDLVLERNEE